MTVRKFDNSQVFNTVARLEPNSLTRGHSCFALVVHSLAPTSERDWNRSILYLAARVHFLSSHQNLSNHIYISHFDVCFCKRNLFFTCLLYLYFCLSHVNV